ncbi:MAG: glucosyl transferase [Leptolyngbyaceae cyanobacterium CSU_1_4]|nr:glucosyl transferase [Leptolyngbyaceae cyanobacterium CSU_1_4]
MILVTVGTERYSFNRLMHWVDLLLQYRLIQEEVVVQYGSCTVLPSGVKVYQNLKTEQFIDLVHQANFVISHCGEGSLLLLEEMEKSYVLVPRSHKFKEHVDDHQIELAIALSQVGGSIAWSAGDLVQRLYSSQPTLLKTRSALATQILCQKLDTRFSSIHPTPDLTYAQSE